MNDMRSEEEQVEALRQWWKENGTSLVTAGLLAIAGTFGWQAWQSNKAASAALASDTYQAMVRSIDAEQESERAQAIDLARALKMDHTSTTYAQFAALHLAAHAVKVGDLETAESELRWVLSKADTGSDNASVAQLRLARVLASAGDEQQALSILSGTDAGRYAASYAVARGDIYLARGESSAAREAYNEAFLLSAAGGAPVNLPSLQQKLQSLAAVASAAPPLESPDLFEQEAPQ